MKCRPRIHHAPEVVQERNTHDLQIMCSIGVIIPTFGRRELAGKTVDRISSQLNSEDVVVVPLVREEDFPQNVSKNVVILKCEKGSAKQRNSALRYLETKQNKVDLVVFLDDDVVLSPSFFIELRAIHSRFPQAAGFTFRLIDDGVGKGGIGYDAACELAESFTCENIHERFIERRDCYGGFSMTGEHLGVVEFDERLAEYGFLEDWDFYSRLRANGPTGHSPGTTLVHLGVASGRVSDRKFGYAQIVNPIYLVLKGSLPFLDGVRFSMLSPFSNALRFYQTERRNRLLGNLLGLFTLLTRGAKPELVARL